MADKERTATAAFLPRGLGKGGAKGRHSSAQSQVGCNPENPGFFPSLERRGASFFFDHQDHDTNSVTEGAKICKLQRLS